MSAKTKCSIDHQRQVETATTAVIRATDLSQKAGKATSQNDDNDYYSVCESPNMRSVYVTVRKLQPTRPQLLLDRLGRYLKRRVCCYEHRNPVRHR